MAGKNRYERDMTARGETRHDEGILQADAYEAIKPKDGRGATVGTSVTLGIEFGNVKVNAYVQLNCEQNEAMIGAASQLAFQKALELADEGLTIANNHYESSWGKPR